MSHDLHLLAFAAHPDDVEISAGGTVAKMVSKGYRCGIVDLTRGELGTRGSGDLREVEAADSAGILGLAVRENLGLEDGFFQTDKDSLLTVIRAIRAHRPKIVLANSISDRHPDHGKGADLVAKAAFYSGLPKIKTELNGRPQAAHRPEVVYHYIQDFYIPPAFVVDVTDFFDTKMAAIRAFSSQFYDPNSAEPITPISGAEFYEFLRGRAMQFGRPCKFLYGEGFTVARPIGVDDLFMLR